MSAILPSVPGLILLSIEYWIQPVNVQAVAVMATLELEFCDWVLAQNVFKYNFIIHTKEYNEFQESMSYPVQFFFEKELIFFNSSQDSQFW